MPDLALGTAPQFGRSLAVGDLNDDGIDDLVVGAPFADPAPLGFTPPSDYLYTDDDGDGIEDPLQETGAVLVFEGNPGGTGSFSTGIKVRFDPYDWSRAGSRTGAQFGWSITVGNYDSDHCLDVAVGAPGDYRIDLRGTEYVSMKPYNSTGSPIPSEDRVGQVYVFPGHWRAEACAWNAASGGDFLAPQVGTMNEQDSEFGYALASGQVLHYGGSSIEDLVVGAPNAESDEYPTVYPGRVYVYYGESEMFGSDPLYPDPPEDSIDIESHSLACPPSDGDRFGHALAVGYFEMWRGMKGTSQPYWKEVAVGAPYRHAKCVGSPGPGNGEGGVYTYAGYSGTTVPQSEILLPLGHAPNSRFGVALSLQPRGDYYADFAHDYNRGQTSLWIGAPGSEGLNGCTGIGAVWDNDPSPRIKYQPL